jgi:hypothetical protein
MSWVFGAGATIGSLAYLAELLKKADFSIGPSAIPNPLSAVKG